MKEHQELQETYADLLNETADPALVQLIQKLDVVANVPQPPISLNWMACKALHNKEMEEKHMNMNGIGYHVQEKIINIKQRQRRRYGLSLIVAVIMIVLVIFAANTILGNVIGGHSASVRMQLAVVENGIVPSHTVMERTVSILSARFSQFGLKGSNISLKQIGGLSTILVTLPSLGSNDQQAVDKLLEPGKVGFWDTGSKILARGTNFNPKDYVQYNPGDQPWFTNKDINLDSLSVSRSFTSPVFYAIGFTMRDEAINRFAQFTGSHLGDVQTITLDGKVLMSAMIGDEIPNGSVGITDNFTTLQQANAIVVALKSGVLPVELRKLA
jgi:preprotein translocase subunit SecD